LLFLANFWNRLTRLVNQESTRDSDASAPTVIPIQWILPLLTPLKNSLDHRREIGNLTEECFEELGDINEETNEARA